MCEELIDYAERMTRGAIAGWPKGTFAFEDYIDGDGFSEEPIPIRVAITVREDDLLVDFAGQLGAGPRGDQQHHVVHALGGLSLGALRARPRRAEQCRSVPLHRGARTAGLDPEPVPAGAGRGAGADRLPRGRRDVRRPRPDRA